MKRLLFGYLVVIVVMCMLIGPLQKTYGDTYRQLKQCLRDNINSTPRCSWARFICVADCYAAWADQKLSININIGDTSTGYDTRYAYANYLMVEGVVPVTVDFDILTTDPLDKIDLYVVNDNYNPGEPDFGLFLGTDDNGGDGWSITFDPDVGGPDDWVGFLVAEAHFPSHPIDPDETGGQGDITAIYSHGTKVALFLNQRLSVCLVLAH